MSDLLHRGRVRTALALAALAVAALVAGCGGSGDSSSGSTTESGCAQVDAPEAKDVSFEAPAQTVKRGEALTATVKTSCGEFEIALDTKAAPKVANSFAFLAREGLYDGLDFYKVISGFAIYGGDPALNGSGGPGYSVVEPPPADTKYSRGVVAMAREPSQPPGYAGSAFFVATSAETGLPPDFALLGRISGGYGTVARINELGSATDQTPEQTVLIEEVTVAKGSAP